MSAPRPATRQAEALLTEMGLSYEKLIGFRFAVNVMISTAIVWTVLRWTGDSNPIWAIASMVAASDPEPMEARRMFKSRLVNVLVGCACGFAFLVVGGTHDWILPIALGVTVLISSYLVRIKTMWRQAPITAALMIASGLTAGSRAMGISNGLHKVAEVLFGCCIGLIVSWLMSKVWILKASPNVDEPGAGS